MPSGGSRCKRIWYYHTIWGNGFTPPQYDLQAKPLAASGWKMVWIKSPWDLICSLYSEQWNKNAESYIESIYVFLTRVDLKSRKYRLFLQTQPDYALKSLGIHKGFLRLFALNPACVCGISVIFFVFRYPLRCIPENRWTPLCRCCRRCVPFYPGATPHNSRLAA